MAVDDEFYHLYGDEDYEHAFDDSMYEPDDRKLSIEDIKRIMKSYPAYYRRKYR